ncbi:MAG: hypothetical protein GY750_08980 [Lentisphaerae bacterium]|nr:hypothetical protein [Lentisphaerota bacterium]
MARSQSLLAMPTPGMDQLSMLQAAVGVYRGKLPDAGYMYSPVYTLLLFIYVVLSHGDLVTMRIMQLLLCGLIPVFIYKLSLRLRLGKPAAQISALLYCFYGPALLVTLDFLRAAPLGLAFIVMVYYLITAFSGKNLIRYMLVGVFAGLCILGRENFAPVMLAPFFLLIFKDVRKYFKVRHGIGYIAGMGAIVLPVMIYNLVQFKSFAVVPGHMGNVIGAYHGQAAVADQWEAFKSIMRNIPQQGLNFISSYEIPRNLSYYAHREILNFLWIFIVPFNLVLVTACAALAFKFKNRGIFLILFLVFAYAGTMLFFTMFYCFRVPVIPLLAVLSGGGCVAVVNAFKQKHIAQGILAVCLIAAFFFATYMVPDKMRKSSERRSVAVFFINKGKYAAAEDYIDELHDKEIKTEKLEHYMIRALYKNNEKQWAGVLMKKWEPYVRQQPQK